MIVTIDTGDDSGELVGLLEAKRDAIDALLAAISNLGGNVGRRLGSVVQPVKVSKKAPKLWAKTTKPPKRTAKPKANSEARHGGGRPPDEELRAWQDATVAHVLKLPKGSNERAEAVYDLSQKSLKAPGREAKRYDASSIRNWMNAAEVRAALGGSRE